MVRDEVTRVKSGKNDIENLEDFIKAAQMEYCHLPGHKRGWCELLGQRISEVKLGKVGEADYILQWYPEGSKTAKAFEGFFQEVLGLVIYTLNDAEANGESFRAGLNKLEEAIKERFTLDQRSMLGLAAGEALKVLRAGQGGGEGE